MFRPLAILLLCSLCMAAGAEPRFKKVLTSAKQGIHTDDYRLHARDFDASTRGNWSIQKTTLHGGKQEGVELITLNNGRLTIRLIPTRGMSILDVTMGDVRLGWDSPVKEVVHPSFINLESRGGLGWLEGFNEMMVRCGLEFAGHPGTDKFINNVGDEAEMDLTLHGKIGNIPASEVEIIIDPDGRLRIRGQVNERMFYGPKLELWTELSTMPDSNSFTIHDQVTSHSAHDQEFQVIYHANYGPTLLEEGSRFVGAAKRVVPFNEVAAKGIKTYAEYAPPTKGFIEQVYCIFPYADDNGFTTVMLHNKAADRAVAITFSTEQLPCFTLWKNTASLEEGYVTGLEPGTGFPPNRSVERKAGRVPKLKPGQTREFKIDLHLIDNQADVQKTAAAIHQIIADRPTTLDPNPLPR